MNPLYKIGDLVFSYQNRDKPEPIRAVRLSDDPVYSHAYKLTLHNDNGSYSSKWIDEPSLYEVAQ